MGGVSHRQCSAACVCVVIPKAGDALVACELDAGNILITLLQAPVMHTTQEGFGTSPFEVKTYNIILDLQESAARAGHTDFKWCS